MSAERLHFQHILFLRGFDPIPGQGLLLRGVAFTLSGHTTTLRRVFWTSDQPGAKTCTWQHTTLTTYTHASGGIRTRHPSKRAATGIGRNITYMSAINYEHAQQGTFRQGMHFIPNICFTHTLNVNSALIFRLATKNINRRYW
jgi:hypothetical protein